MPSRKTPGVPTGQDQAPTAAELRDLVVQILTGAAGRDEDHWRELVGEVEVLPIVLHPRSNWKADPNGTWQEVETIWKAVEVVRAAHPYVR